MRTIRWGMIGAGSVTEAKSGPAFKRVDGSDMVAVMRRTGNLARDYAERHAIPRWYDNAEALINASDVDAVYIATPPASHHDYTLMCARAGKHVYVEKPMAISSAECLAMIAACADAGVGLFVAYYRRALERFVAVRSLANDGTIGQVRAITMRLYRPLAADEQNPATWPWRVRPEIAGGGHFVDVGSHMLDLVDFICSPIQHVSGFATNQAGAYPAEDMVTGAFLCENGVHVSGTWCSTSAINEDCIEVIGSAGLLRFSAFRPEPVRVITQRGVRELVFQDPVHIQQPLIETVVKALHGTGICPSTGETGARTSRVMEQLLESYRQGRG